MRPHRITARVLLLLASAALTGCAAGPRPASTGSAPVVDSAAVRLAGAYLGTLPCDDCDGVETALLLRADASYQLATRRLKASADTTVNPRGSLEVRHGRFEWNRARGELRLDSVTSVANRYRVGDGQLVPLDSITSAPLAERYLLRRSGSARRP